MQGIKQYLFLSIIGILFSLVYSRSIVEKDHNCVIIVNNQYAAKSDDKKYHKRQEPKQFVNSLMLEINELIVENKDTYENPKNLEQTNLLNKRGDEKDVGYVKYISTIDEYTILSAYLSHQLNEDVKAIPGVESCGPEINFRILSQDKIVEVEPRKEKEHVKRSESKKSLNSFINDIKAQTGWKDVGVRKSVTNNYSLMSQGFYNGKHSSYDQNYYYPKSGGKDIDIYLIDSGFDFTHSDFSNKNERQAQCIAYIEINNRAVTKINQKQCISEFNNEYYVGRHGEYTSRAIAGKDFGVAPNANIYGISINYINEYKISDMKLYKFLDFLLYEIEIRPNKSILALPIMLNYDYTFEFDNKKNKFNLIQKYINALTKKGVIVIASAGNGVDEDSNGNYIGRPVRDKDYRIFPCSLDNVICVGGIDNFGIDRDERVNEDMKTHNYRKLSLSNYGKDVDLYAPAVGDFTRIVNNKPKVYQFIGTSLSTALVSGVAATIMSEFSDIKFDYETMKSYLNKIGLKNVISGIPSGPNVFINNGKHLVYGDDSVTVGQNDVSPYDIPDIGSDSEIDD